MEGEGVGFGAGRGQGEGLGAPERCLLPLLRGGAVLGPLVSERGLL